MTTLLLNAIQEAAAAYIQYIQYVFTFLQLLRGMQDTSCTLYRSYWKYRETFATEETLSARERTVIYFFSLVNIVRSCSFCNIY